MAWSQLVRPILASLVGRFAIGLCPVFVFAMLGIPRTLLPPAPPIIISTVAAVSILVCYPIELIHSSLTLPSFLPSFLLQERFGGHTGSGGTFQDSCPFNQHLKEVWGV
jgi:hypothetical protein